MSSMLCDVCRREELDTLCIFAASAGVMAVHLGGLEMANLSLVDMLPVSSCQSAAVGVDQSFMFSVQLFGRTRLSMMSSACSRMNLYRNSISKSLSPPATLSATLLKQSSLDKFDDM